MTQYVIERDIAGVGRLSRERIKEAASTANGALAMLAGICDAGANVRIGRHVPGDVERAVMRLLPHRAHERGQVIDVQLDKLEAIALKRGGNIRPSSKLHVVDAEHRMPALEQSIYEMTANKPRRPGH